MVTIFAVFLLLPMSTGLDSYACKGTSDESGQHSLSCKRRSRINIIRGLYGFKYSSDLCSRDCSYQSRYCDCSLGFNRTVESDLINSCNGKNTCSFRPPNSYYDRCYNISKYYDNYTYSYIEYVCSTDIVDEPVFTVSFLTIIFLIFSSVAVCILLKRKQIRDKHRSRVRNLENEAPRRGYNSAISRNDNSPSVSVVKSDVKNHLHAINKDNSMATGNTYNHMGQMGGDYNHLHANNNSPPVDEQSGGAYNHLGMVNFKTHNSDYNHLNGLARHNSVSEEVYNANYNHLGDVKNEIPKAYYNHLDKNKKIEISNEDYNHIGGITNERTGDSYRHLDNVNEHVVNKADSNDIVAYELAKNSGLHVRTEQAPDAV
ncbi:probable serine/threonine-protein kinase fhkB [Patella vulgata]|uniref:probable serine/threonine-protein kinase fhkB n=1 Tax=Patella vulgata TaxID=6465 RepID=UPI00217F3DFB|nr:probable serine/threonine-protein kinase fhkB [Patella vulgata]XP_050393433.1 probable serine/threonine-protein kinase fhkB [Patella vulgata]